MISAVKARGITIKVINERRAYEKAMIAREVKSACEEIKYAANHGCEVCEISTKNFGYPKSVASHLKNELGFVAVYDSDCGVIKVSW